MDQIVHHSTIQTVGNTQLFATVQHHITVHVAEIIVHRVMPLQYAEDPHRPLFEGTHWTKEKAKLCGSTSRDSLQEKEHGRL